MKQDLSGLRKNYESGHLGERDLADSPYDQFALWFRQASDAHIPEPNAMILSTSGRSGTPSSRVVLLKEFGTEGFTFYTNYHSRKGIDIAENPHVALLFSWITLERQIRIEGVAEKNHPMESDAYFISRPTGSRLGAWASEQSAPISSRELLEQRMAYYSEQFGESVPRPDHWGGYVVKPSMFEFWQGRADRLHDRFRYTLPGSDILWKIERLSP
jgi:pyridoxamine 5'-phosphate oxidase